VNVRVAHARVIRPGVAVSALIAALLLLGACGQAEPQSPTGPRTWEGGDLVSSSGVIGYERREIAQKVSLPGCITVGGDRYRFAQVTPYEGGGATPPGLDNTYYRLDRWQLWKRVGPLEGQPTLFVTVRGSTGYVAEYRRVAPGEPCGD